ncbi:hypothetical protein [Alteromonas sp. ASW11-130]|uniref:hypothetical protein n=1 Tax=Alteromonas sp. ASW11-130 TaxID=3015775 RepID=UPI002242B08C|nr:hypothetical protein [Alteromonas sp. ASW11-130]MCW8090310.1 hypothetical protein [Alteromonas sp. ASW11-130]
MEISYKVILPTLVWLAFVLLILFFCVLYRWAKQRKGAALAIGLFIQMFLPDPKVQQTIEFVAESKEQTGDKQSDKRLRDNDM